MVKNKYITKEEMEKAYNEELIFIGSNKENNLSTIMYYEDVVIKEEMEFVKNLDYYQYKDTYESDEDFYFETQELLSTEQGIKNYISSNKEFMNSLENDIDDPEIRKVFDQGLKANDSLREYKKDLFKDKNNDELEII